MKTAFKKEYTKVNKEKTKQVKEIKALKKVDFLQSWEAKKLTKKQLENFKNGKLKISHVKQILITKAEQNHKEKTKALTTKFDAIENTGNLLSIKIVVEWKKSPTWGANPKATVKTISINKEGQKIYNTYMSCSVGGCGYCKESTAVAEAMNKSPEILKILYINANKRINKKQPLLYGCDSYFSGGAGVSCFFRLFLEQKFIQISELHTKTIDIYNFIK